MSPGRAYEDETLPVEWHVMVGLVGCGDDLPNSAYKEQHFVFLQCFLAL